MKKFELHASCLFRIIVLLLIFAKPAKGMLVVKPPATVHAVLEGTARLNCSTNLSSGIHWWHKHAGATKPEVVYNGTVLNGYAYHERYRVAMDPRSGRFDLVIQEIQMEDSGVYYCVDIGERNQEAEAYLDVNDGLEDPIVKPDNTTALTGESVKLRCTSCCREQVYWYFKPVGKDTKILYYGDLGLQNGFRTNGRHSVDMDNKDGRYDLVINPVQPSDAGTYTCIDQSGIGREARAQLVVLGSRPTCGGNFSSDGVLVENSCGLEPDIITLSCRNEFFGTVPPRMVWMNVTTNTTYSDVTCNVLDTSITCSITVHARIDTRWLDYVCKVADSMTCRPSAHRIETIYVFDAHASITSNRLKDNITCAVKSSQSCLFKWEAIDDSHNTTVSYDQIFHPVCPGRYVCTARCPIRGVDCIVNPVSLTYNSYADEGIGKAGTVLVSVILTSLICATVGIALHCLCPRHSSEIYSYKVYRMEELKVKGSAILYNNLYVIIDGSSSIRVYRGTAPYTLVRLINVNGMNLPQDISPCQTMNCLHIIERQGHDTETVVWQVTVSRWIPSRNSNIERFSFPPSSSIISVTPSGLIIRKIEDRLEICDLYGTRIECISFDCSDVQLSSFYMRSDNEIIQVVNKEIRKYVNWVRENGCVLRTRTEENNSDEINPERAIPGDLLRTNWDVTFGNDGLLFVLDRFHRKVLVFDQSFNSEVEIPINLCSSTASRICFNDKTKKLLVITSDGHLWEATCSGERTGTASKAVKHGNKDAKERLLA